MNWLLRMRYRLRFWRTYEASLNRRADVETELFEMARGKRPLPTAEDCRRMANKLGMPSL